MLIPSPARFVILLSYSKTKIFKNCTWLIVITYPIGLYASLFGGKVLGLDPFVLCVITATCIMVPLVSWTRMLTLPGAQSVEYETSVANTRLTVG